MASSAIPPASPVAPQLEIVRLISRLILSSFIYYVSKMLANVLANLGPEIGFILIFTKLLFYFLWNVLIEPIRLGS